MKLRNYLFISALALFIVGCQDKGDLTPGNTPTPGAEVVFGAQLGEPGTKTVYGEEGATSIPIYWEQGDQVLIYAPSCLSGRNSAAYAVSVESQTQNYATSLNKTGEYGIQWGDNETSNFFSVYPNSRVSAGESGESSTSITLHMPERQYITIADDNKSSSADMDACYMYAQTFDAQNGQPVNLQYHPMAAALRFEVQGPTAGQGSTSQSVTIRDIRIHAPVAICGDYTVSFSNTSTVDGPSLTSTSTANQNDVYLSPAYANGAFLTLAPGQKVKVNAFIMLTEEAEVNGEWYIQLTDSYGNIYKKSLNGVAANGRSLTLQPGKIHDLPALPAINADESWDSSNWMVNIPRNVYLSEISVPGSWNSLNADFQNNVTDALGNYRDHDAIIGEQYAAGVRAFHLDTRWKRTLTSIIPFRYQYTLSVADGRSTGSLGNHYAGNNNPTVEQALTDIKFHLNDSEYMILYCTFAQGSTEPVDAGDWEKAIYDLCANDEQVVLANDLDPNTTVADVLGKVLVIVNTDGYSDANVGRSVFFNYSMTLTSSTVSTTSPLYRDGSFTNSTGITIYGSHAQVTSNGDQPYDNVDDRGYAPTIAQRTGAINAILDASKANYANQTDYVHDTWYYLGVGGYTCNSRGGSVDYTAVEPLRQLIDTRINAMTAQTGYYPVGIVLMNNAVTNSSTCNNILQLNNKYQKAYDANRSPIDGSVIGDGSTTTNTVSTSSTPSMTNGGNAF